MHEDDALPIEIRRCWERSKWPSDISEHAETLREYASRCTSVLEFGVRAGCSTGALMAGCQNLTSCDIAEPSVTDLKGLVKHGWKFHKISSLELPPREVDMLFIDSKHQGQHLAWELHRHAGHVRKWIILHDTETFALCGDGGGDGLKPVIDRFVENGPWEVEKHYSNCNGLTILRRSE